MYENQLIISAVDGNGQIIASQPYAEFIYGKKNLEILNYYTGQKLFDILHDDLGKIRFEDNKFVLKSIYLMSPLQTTMNLLGKIAEAVLRNQSPYPAANQCSDCCFWICYTEGNL